MLRQVTALVQLLISTISSALSDDTPGDVGTASIRNIRSNLTDVNL